MCLHKFREPLDKRTTEGLYERITNRFQVRLVRTYDGWGRVTRGAMRRIVQRGLPPSVLNSLVDGRVDILLNELEPIIKTGIRTASIAAVGSQRVKTPVVKAAVAQRIAKEIGYLQTSLGPDLKTSIRATGTNVALIKPVIDASRARISSYAGAAWVMIFESQKAAGQEDERESGEPQMVRWVLAEDAVHCKAGGGRLGCIDLEGSYDSWNALPTVPAGNVTCSGNCRCHLEVFENGAWQRGL